MMAMRFGTKGLKQDVLSFPEDGNILDRAAWANLLEGIEVNVIKRQPRYRRDNVKIT